MSEALLLVLSLSLSGTLLWALLCLTKPWWRRFVSRTWQYYLYLVIILRLLLPFSPEINVTGALLAQTPATAVIETMEAKLTLPDTEPVHVPAPAWQADIPAAFSAGDVLGGLWLAVALTLMLRQIIGYRRFCRQLWADSAAVTNQEALALYGALTQGQRAPALRLCPVVTTPMLAGFFRPVIYLPALPPVQSLRYILLHELAHAKRLDPLCKWLVQLARCLHWFNPFVYPLVRQIDHACELACDEALIKRLDAKEQRAYGDTLLDALAGGQAQPAPNAALALGESAQLLKERLEAIMTYKHPTRLLTAAAVLFTTLFCATAAAAGAYTQPEAPIFSANKDQHFTYILYDEKAGSTYTQSGYYQDGYIIQIGWNASARYPNSYPASANVTLPDGSDMLVRFDADCASSVGDRQVLAAISQILPTIQAEAAAHDMTLTEPLVVAVDGPYSQSPLELAARFYQEERLVHFAAVLPYLAEEEQIAYIQRTYSDDRVAFFGASVGQLSAESRGSLLPAIASAAYRDGEVAYFSMCLDELSQEEIARYASAAYDTGDVAIFSIALNRLPAETAATYAEAAYKDEEIALFSVALEHLTAAERADFKRRAAQDGNLSSNRSAATSCEPR